VKSARAIDQFEFELALWRQGIAYVAGVDEAGRGPLAGPVMAAAVVFPAAWADTGLPSELKGLNDSKQLSPQQRERFYAILTALPQIQFAIGQATVQTIDGLNILRATYQAMNQALAQLRPTPQHVLVDGLHVPAITLPQTALIEGDCRSYSIAAASVLAKVTRDRLMLEMDRLYPVYGFADHKGYGTERHLAALAEHGPCPIHRRSFAPLRLQQGELF
jgi:ribonuclease HII